MNRKLLILDVVLGAGAIYGGFQLHSEWVAARARQAAMPGPAPKAGAIPAMPPLPQKPAVLPSGYKDVAVNTLFDPSRTPTVPVDPPPPPPPPKEPPPLPSFHGMMDFGDPQGPIALITEPDEPRHEEFHAGEMIGEFKLVAFNRQEMTLEWDGRIIHKRLNEGGSDPTKRKATVVEPAFVNGIIPGRAPQQEEKPRAQLGPGQPVNETTRACQSGDNSPNDTVADGYRKVSHINGLGAMQCFWTAVGK